MLHEILLSLSGHPSPLLLRADGDERAHHAAGITPPERQLIASAAHLSDLHIKLIADTAQIAAQHPSVICRAVATGIRSVHLSAFQRKVLEVEESILKDDPDLVGAYNIVPLTALMAEFKGWTRRMEWLWELVRFMSQEKCQGSQLMNRLREDLLSGYPDIAETAMALVTIAETAWLKQVSAWVLYGRLPNVGRDFFVRKAEEDSDEDYICIPELLPSFVAPSTASSMLFIGKSLNHKQVRVILQSGLRGFSHVSEKLKQLANLQLPLDSVNFSRAITDIRLSLAEDTLQKILPLSRVVSILQLLRDFFLVGRGEFAMALTQEADEKIRNRWRRAENLAYEHQDSLKNVAVKDGEVAAVLARTWAVLASMQGQHAEEDEQLELARDILRLHLVKPTSAPPMVVSSRLDRNALNILAASPFRDLLFSAPASLTIQLPTPLDMVLSTSDLQLYSCINAYLLAMRRAHLRLTDLWKITSLRRHHPAVGGADEQAVLLRQRWSARSLSMRSTWTTASAAIFLLGETEAYLQTEVVAGLWEGFHSWLTGQQPHDAHPGVSLARASRPEPGMVANEEEGHEDEDEDLWLSGDASANHGAADASDGNPKPQPPHDPQSLSTAHTLYLGTLIHRLLLTQPSFTNPLYALLVHIDHLVTHVHRLHSIFTSIDLEMDAGVVDAFVDLEREEREVKAMLRVVEGKVKRGIEEVVEALRVLESDMTFMAECEGEDVQRDGVETVGYTPARVGGVNRLLMKLDFGTWFGPGNEWSR
ncbi:gamma-tubulin complex component protein [Stachybotrys elegans]|uniref:Spindle pole body component n=1 Tax=Stachybotrys elegans TaxID=80388 RepID=A0A8K0WTU7_9HYPO|nr:gamma-tubulin complex component protein [Stachybotrys elegans]